MQEHATDPDVFIRSMATRGHLGGMALAAPEAVRILDAAGHDVVLIETVGVGQAEVEVAAAADTAVVVLAPGMGDAVQMAKAGILEVADVFVGRPREVPAESRARQMLHSGPRGRGASVLAVSASKRGMAESRRPASRGWPVVGRVTRSVARRGDVPAANRRRGGLGRAASPRIARPRGRYATRGPVGEHRRG
jgi:LAO/AO transport system kinase